MGLAEVKRKQRLVGSAQTKNVAWTNDASLPGQRLLASMGWSAGQGIGQSKSGMVAPVSVAFKMDNKGIGAQRLEREARASGQTDAWIGGGGELGNLFDRLNAAAVSNSNSNPSTEISIKPSEEDLKKKEKRERKAKKKEKKNDKSKEVIEEAETVKPKGDNAPVMINPRMAARARYLKAKRMVGNDLSSVNEILGIASPSGSNSPAPIASPVLSPKPTEPQSEIDKTESDRKKEKKRKREEANLGNTDSVKSEKGDRKKRKEEKRMLKASKKEEKKKAKIEAKQASQQTISPSIVMHDTSDPSFSASGGGNRVSSLSVQQYLSNKLMMRKAEIVRKRRMQEEGVWNRAATVQA